MAAPTYVAEYPTAFNTTTTPKTAMSAVAVNAGDVLVGLVCGENHDLVLALTENGSASWATQQSSGTTDYTELLGSTYVVADNENLTVTATNSGSLNDFGANVVRFSVSDGVGASNKAEGASGDPSVTLTTTQDNSAIVVICGDWNAVSGTQTFTNNFSGTPTALTDYPGDSANYGVAICYFPDAGTAGSKTVGMSAPTGQKWTIIAIEVKGTASGGPTISAHPSSVEKFTSETANFSVTASGTGTLTYQWKVSTDGSSYSNVSTGTGGTTSSYTTAALGYSDNADYYKCTVTDDNGSTDSNVAFLTVIGAASGAWLRF